MFVTKITQNLGAKVQIIIKKTKKEQKSATKDLFKGRGGRGELCSHGGFYGIDGTNGTNGINGKFPSSAAPPFIPSSAAIPFILLKGQNRNGRRAERIGKIGRIGTIGPIGR